VVVRMGDSKGLRIFKETDEDGSDCSRDDIHHHVRHEEAHLREGGRWGGREGRGKGID